MRNSTFGLEYRELPAGVRQQTGRLELASERLSQIFCIFFMEESRCRRSPCRYKGKDIRATSVSIKCVKSFMKSEWYRVGQ